MKKIQFCKINLDYVKYLYSIDHRVQYNEKMDDQYNKNRPYIGVVFTINSKYYFAPMEHPRPQHLKLKNNVHIFKIKGGKYGIIGLNNMIPVPLSEVVLFDINIDKNKKLLISQYIFCQKQIDKLLDQASRVYSRRKHLNAFESKIYCDFEKLEAAADVYVNEHSKNQP